MLHDSYPSTVEAVERLIPALKEKGYRFVTVDELFYARDEKLEDGGIYSRHPPQGNAGL